MSNSPFRTPSRRHRDENDDDDIPRSLSPSEFSSSTFSSIDPASSPEKSDPVAAASPGPKKTKKGRRRGTGKGDGAPLRPPSPPDFDRAASPPSSSPPPPTPPDGGDRGGGGIPAGLALVATILAAGASFLAGRAAAERGFLASTVAPAASLPSDEEGGIGSVDAPRAFLLEREAAEGGGGAVPPRIVSRRLVEIGVGEDLAADDEEASSACDKPSVGQCLDEDEEDDDEEDNDSDDDGEDEEEDDDVSELVPRLHYNDPGTGQNLFFDVDSVVPASVLASETALVDAIRSAVSPHWNVLSYHCRRRPDPSSDGPSVIGCAGILSDRASFAVRGDPSSRSVEVSLFTSSLGTAKLHELMPRLKSEFLPEPTGDEREDRLRDTRARQWVQYRQMGDKEENGRDPYQEDLGYFFFERRNVHKIKVASAESIFQRIDIYDMIVPHQLSMDSYRKTLMGGDTFEATHPEQFQPNRVVFLDGVIQSSYRHDEAYHEALAHPAMFAHPDPKRVAIIGGGEGATLREVLKHDTLEHVKMIDIDEVMVKMSDVHLPTWNDCSDIVGSVESCFEDPRADVLYEDAMAWFINRFADAPSGHLAETLQGTERPFDVIVMDALDPQDTVEFANILYNSDVFVRSIKNGLTDDGVLVMQLGKAMEYYDPPEQHSLHNNRDIITRMIADLGFRSMHIYEESHCGFNAPWTFLVACKSDCRRSFFRNAAEIDLAIRQRIRPSKSGGAKSLLKYFDGETMGSYQRPSKAFESTFCRSVPAPPECEFGKAYRKDSRRFGVDDFEVRTSEDGSGTVGVFAKVDVPAYSYVKTGEAFRVSPATAELLGDSARGFGGDGTSAKPLMDILEKHGLESTLKGQFEWYVDPGLYSLMNHGCNGTSNVGHLASWTYKNTKPEQYFEAVRTGADRSGGLNPIEAPSGREAHEYFSVRSPVLARHVSSYAAGYLMSLRDIRKGEEVTTNHLHRRSDGAKWDEFVSKLEEQCRDSVRAGQTR